MSTERTGTVTPSSPSNASRISANCSRPMIWPASASTRPRLVLNSVADARPISISFGSPVGIRSGDSMYSSVPQSSIRMITSCATSTRRRVR